MAPGARMVAGSARTRPFLSRCFYGKFWRSAAGRRTCKKSVFKTVTQFMRYVHAEDDPVRAAAETVASRRRPMVSGQQSTSQPADNMIATGKSSNLIEPPAAKPAAIEDELYNSKLGNHRPFRHRSGSNRAAPSGTKRAGKTLSVAAE